MRRLRAAVDRGVGWLLVVLMGVAVLNVLWQVFTRYVLSDPSSYTEELARYLLVWISVLGAGYAVGTRMHLAIELLPVKLADRRAGAALEVFIQLCVFLFALLVLVVGGIALVQMNLRHGQTSPALGLKVGLVYCVLPLSGLVMTFYALSNVAQRLGGAGEGEEGERESA